MESSPSPSSDSENRTPEVGESKIQTKGLSQYRIILAPKKPTPPTKAQIKAAVRCRKAGMFPGAIRKYLLSKKKHEEDVGEEEEEEEREGGQQRELSLPLPLPLNDVASISSNSPLNLSQWRNGQHREEPVRRDDDDDDDVIVVEDVPPVQEEACIPPVNRIDSISSPSGSSGSSSKPCSRKRSFAEVFSPDTTTPEAPESEEGNECSGPMLEASGESTPTKAPLSQQPKRPRKDKSRVSQPVRETLQRKTKSVTSCSGSSTSNNSNSDVVRKIMQDDGPKFQQETNSADLEKLMRRLDWRKVIGRFEENLSNKVIPDPKYVGELVKKAILGIGHRSSRDVPDIALKYFSRLVETYKVDISLDSYIYYSSIFTTACDSMTEFLYATLSALKNDANANLQSKAITFFKVLTKMVVAQYQHYSCQSVKLRPPFFVQFLEEDTRPLEYNDYCKRLLQFVFELKDHPEELKLVMRWVGLLGHHLRKHTNKESEFSALTMDFVNNICKPEHAKRTCELVQAIKDASLGAAVCLQILKKRVEFQSKQTNHTPTDEEIGKYLRIVAQSESVAALKSFLDERTTTEYTPLQVSSLVGGKKKKEERKSNLAGDHYLHKLCKKTSNANEANSLTMDLAKGLKAKAIEVNPTDNFGNIPLHDAVAHDRLEAVKAFYDYCSDPNLPFGLRVNVLAQNKLGDTPLHLAAISTNSEEMATVLLDIAERLQVKEEALKTLNQQGKMPYELAFNGTTRSLLKPPGILEWVFDQGGVNVPPQHRTELQSIDCKKLIILYNEFYKKEREERKKDRRH